MDAELFAGHHCPRCGSVVGLSVGVGGELRCPGCAGPMQTAPGGPNMRILTNVNCKNCGTRIGLLTVVGSDSLNCPSCGKSLQ